MFFKHKPIHEFSDLATRGRGFLVNGQRFVHHMPIAQHQSAAISITRSQKLHIFGGFVVLGVLFYFTWFYTLLSVIIILTVFYFADLLFGLFLAYRSFTKSPEIFVSEEEIAALPDSILPRYTIFCPLYKEWRVLPQFVEAIQNLDYPKNKLQVMLQLEEDDAETVLHAQSMELPDYFEIVVVPHSKPKTKPKAMNYGLGFATGEIITIYDAEDVPEVTQLKKVVVAFMKAGPKTVCIQGKLNFYNPYQNLLTRMFTAEYSLWFDLVLPGLQSIHAPIPLGGTSNNFRKDILDELAGWDAYNVTEDCDLGMRLAKKGYRTAIVDSTTLEEANSGYHNWYRQRSRWIKGYMQTYLVHMRSPRATIKEFGLRNFLLLQLTVGGKVLSMFVNPLMWVITICYFAFRADVAPYIEPLFPPAVLYLGVVSLVAGNFFYMYAYLVGLAKRGEFSVMKYVVFVPFYWLAMSVAAWKAFYELVVKPHYWQKTQHGLHLTKPEQQDAVVPQSLKTHSKKVLPTLPQHGATSIAAGAMQQLPIKNASISLAQKRFSDLSHKKEVLAEEVVRRESSTVNASSESGGELPQSFIAHVLALLERFAERLGFKGLQGGVWLVAAMLGANFLNFLFSGVLGRKLTPENFGTLTLFATIIQLLSIVAGAVGSSVTYKIARFAGSKHIGFMELFVRRVARSSFMGSLVIAGLWAAVTPLVARFFHITDPWMVLAFAPIFPIMMSQAIWGGYLRGDFAFKYLAIGTLSDPIIKLLVGIAFVYSGRTDLAPLAVLFAVAASWLTLFTLGQTDVRLKEFLLRTGEITDKPVQAKDHGLVRFPSKYFTASLLASSSTTLFLTADVLLVKHFFTPSLAGQYALLSLCGNMIFYLCSLPSVFITTAVSRARGEGKDGREAFLPLFRLVVAAAVCGFVGAGVFGRYTIPLMFGSNALPIVSYLPLYTAALGLMAICSSYIAYRIARDDFRFTWFGVIGAAAMAAGIWLRHGSIGEVATGVFVSSASIAVLLFLFHAVSRHGRYVFRNVVDFLDIFLPIPSLPKSRPRLSPGAKRILIFNWRDTRHVHAGGAEVYVHEIAKRWVAEGNIVTLFCGNDGSAPRFEKLDGVNIIRRGGFYMVWVWAFLYYMFRLRGKFDIIVDNDSALPFFTPIYAKEPVVCLLHHVHQDIFKSFLPWPASAFACFLEAHFMPFIYRNIRFITVSASTKLAMEELGIGRAGIEVINPGVSLETLVPGDKDSEPMVLYVGRLNKYKSVDVLIRAFELLHVRHPKARLVVAGGGDEEENLKILTKKLGLSSVVTFLGKVEEEVKVFLMQQAWVFANPSSMEGWGITSIEANACGTPVVASNVPGLRDSVRNPHTGYLVEYGNPAAFAEKIDLLLTNTKQRKFMEQESLEWAQNFDWDTIAEKNLNFIKLVKK